MNTTAWAELVYRCADDCDPATHPLQQVLLRNMANGIFPIGVQVVATIRPQTSCELFCLHFTPKAHLGPECLPPNLMADTAAYTGKFPLVYSFFPKICAGDRGRKNSGRQTGSTASPSVYPLDPCAPVRDTRIAITVLTEWYCAYQAASPMTPWGKILHRSVSPFNEERHTRNTRLMRVLDNVHSTALREGNTDAAAVSLARRVLHLHTLGDIALAPNDQWFYTGTPAKDRQPQLLP